MSAIEGAHAITHVFAGGVEVVIGKRRSLSISPRRVVPHPIPVEGRYRQGGPNPIEIYHRGQEPAVL